MEEQTTNQPPPTGDTGTRLERLDAWMASNPWHPRVVPFFVYILALALASFVPGGDRVAALAYLPIYLTANILILWLLWRYRKLTPELNLRFHWTVIPSAAFLTFAWVALGYGYNTLFFGGLEKVALEDADTFGELVAVGPAVFWTVFVARGLGMSIVVALFEELFIRSAMLRGLHRWRLTKTGLLQVAHDLPALGDVVADKPAVIAAQKEPPAFTVQLTNTPLGRVTVFATVASTLVFMLSHGLRDWAGCIACGVVWCAMVWWTNRERLPVEKRAGLGPVVWSHGLVNAALWVFTYTTGDWQFL